MFAPAAMINLLLVYLLMFVSGSLVYGESAENYLVLIFIFVTLVWLVRTDKKVDGRFVLYVCMFAGFLLTISLYTGGSLPLSSVMSTTLKLLLAYLLLKTIGASFPEVYVKVVVFLAIISLLGYTSDSFLLFGDIVRKLPVLTDVGYEGIFYLFRFRFHIDRNNSIFFEPGAYQVFLNVALFILFFVETSIDNRKRWVYIAILLITLLTTFSTTGFMIFVASFGLFLPKSRLLSTSGKAVLIGVLLLLVMASSNQVVNTLAKIGGYSEIKDITDVKQRRAFDAIVDMEVFKKHIFGAGYKKYREEFSRIGQVSEASARYGSNGITKTLAIFGLPFALFLFSSYYWAIRQLLAGYSGILMKIIPFGMLLIFLYSEGYYVFAPFTLSLIAGAFVFGPQIQFAKEHGAEANG